MGLRHRHPCATKSATKSAEEREERREDFTTEATTEAKEAKREDTTTDTKSVKLSATAMVHPVIPVLPAAARTSAQTAAIHPCHTLLNTFHMDRTATKSATQSEAKEERKEGSTTEATTEAKEERREATTGTKNVKLFVNLKNVILLLTAKVTTAAPSLLLLPSVILLLTATVTIAVNCRS